MSFVADRFHLDPEFVRELRSRPVRFGFGPVSETVFYRTYSRPQDGGNEGWADVVVRSVEGAMSIRKDWYRNVIGKRWPRTEMEALARAMAEAIFDLKFVPPGRGLWAMGTDFVYDRGSTALNNCGFVSTSNRLSEAAAWAMDALMMGVGVGFDTRAIIPSKAEMLPLNGRVITVKDSREGWVRSTAEIIRAWENGSSQPNIDYSKIRPAGTPIRGFGGVSGGPEPLIKLHETLRKVLSSQTDPTRIVADVMNAIGVCVVAGNVRRSAQIALGSPRDETFLDLKDYAQHPDRAELGWMSNNSVTLDDPSDFELLPDVARRVRHNGEPGTFNRLMTQKYGRTGKHLEDLAVGLNPCAEIPLESSELCNLVEVFPTRHATEAELMRTLQLATFYASTVALLRSHDESTNEVVSRNRRIGVSMSGIADWIERDGVSAVFGAMNRGYDVVRDSNKQLAKSAGVPESVRVTTVKPSGSVSLLAGVSPGVHWPYASHVVRRIRVGDHDPVNEVLQAAGVPNEEDKFSDATRVYEFPLQYGGGRTRSAREVSLWEQAALVAMAQRAWADNAVSNTLTFRPDEEAQVEAVLSYYAPQVKSMSMLPHREGIYEQMPLEEISPEEFRARRESISKLDWRAMNQREAEDVEKYCTTDACEIPTS